MTKDINMMTDAELARAVAIEVLHWTCRFDDKGIEHFCSPSPSEDSSLSIYTDYLFFSWIPTIDINHAWQLLECMKRQGMYLHLCESTKETYAEFYRYSTQPWCERNFHEKRTFGATAPVAPRAICEAALKAVRSERA